MRSCFWSFFCSQIDPTLFRIKYGFYGHSRVNKIRPSNIDKHSRREPIGESEELKIMN